MRALPTIHDRLSRTFECLAAEVDPAEVGEAKRAAILLINACSTSREICDFVPEQVH